MLPTSTLTIVKLEQKSKINITENRHFTLAYLLGKLGYRLYSQRDKNRLYICHFRLISFGQINQTNITILVSITLFAKREIRIKDTKEQVDKQTNQKFTNS